MPIYRDYQGGSKDSSISSWDQIQISLKCLLPSYQPIPSDYLDELSFLTFQKQKRICAEIKEVCNNMCATLNEMIREEEKYLDSEIHTHSKQNADPEFPVKIQREQETADQQPESEIDDVDAATIQIATEITDSVTNQNPDSEIQVKNQANRIICAEIEDPDQEFAKELEAKCSKLEPELNTAIQSKCESIEIQQSTIQNQITENMDLHEDMDEADLEIAEETVNQPPPKPPDQQSLAKELFSMQTSACHSVIEVAEKEYELSNDTVDGAVAKGKVEDVGSADLTRRSSAVVGASAEGIWTAAGRTAATGADVSRRANQLRRLVLLTPPPLLAAVFPWDRDGEWHNGEWQWRAATSAGGREEGIVTGGDEGSVALEGRVLLPEMVEARRGGNSDVVSSLFSFEYSRKAGSVFLLAAAAATNAHPQAIVGRCSPGPAGVEFAEAWWKLGVRDQHLNGVSFLFWFQSVRENATRGGMGHGGMGLGKPNSIGLGPIRVLQFVVIAGLSNLGSTLACLILVHGQ